MLCPWTRTSPVCGRSSPLRWRSSVDLPAPLGPVIATISPGRTVRPRSRSSGSPAAPPARGKPKPTPSSSSTGAAAGSGAACPDGGHGVGDRGEHGPGPGEFRGPDQLPGRAAGGGGAAVEDDPVRGGAGQAVGCLAQHHDGGTGAGEPADEVPDLDDARSVQGGQRLVKHQHPGVLDDGAGDGQPAQFPAGEGGGVPVQERCQAGQLRDAGDLPEHVRPRGAAVLEAEGEFLGHGGADRGEHGGRILRDVAHPVRPGGGIDPGVVLAAAELQQLAGQRERTGERSGVSGPEPAGQQLAQGGLAAAGTAEDGRQGAGTDAEIDVAQRRGGLAVEAEAADPGGQHGVGPERWRWSARALSWEPRGRPGGHEPECHGCRGEQQQRRPGTGAGRAGRRPRGSWSGGPGCRSRGRRGPGPGSRSPR